MRRKASAVTLPNLFEVFCEELTCTATLEVAAGASIERLYGRRKRGGISNFAKYLTKKGAIHALASVRKREKGELSFFFGLHTLTSLAEENSRSTTRIERFLDSLGQLCAETTVVVTGAFRYPRIQYRPSLAFPDASSIGIPMGEDLTVSITGLRFRLDAGPVRSVIVDVHNPETIFVSTQMVKRTRISGSLPQECLEGVAVLAKTLVTSLGGAE